jgi:pyridoxine 5-phosphate synthase
LIFKKHSRIKKSVKLGVNIDHIATLRQARKEAFPDVVSAALECLKGGANGIVFHLREDRRHIQDADVYSLKEQIRTRLDMEMAAEIEMLNIALKVKPEMVTLVPEKREEVTTEGGLDVMTKGSSLKSTIEPLRRAKINVSLFVDPVSAQIDAAARTGANFIEIHTGAYANAKSEIEQKERLKDVSDAADLAKSLGLRVNAGHGLDYKNAKAIALIDEIEELNIGFSIIARAVFVGLKQAVREMKRTIST